MMQNSISIRLSEDLQARIRVIAFNKGVSKTALIEEMIIKALNDGSYDQYLRGVSYDAVSNV